MELHLSCIDPSVWLCWNVFLEKTPMYVMSKIINLSWEESTLYINFVNDWKLKMILICAFQLLIIVNNTIKYVLKYFCFIGCFHGILILNSSSPGRCGNDFESVISKHMLQIKFMSTCEITLRWMPWNTFDGKSTLVWVMACCCQATSHYLSQCWSRFMWSYDLWAIMS